MSDTSLKIPKFSGEKKDWQLWSEVFKSKMIMKDLLEVFVIDPIKMPDKDYDRKDTALADQYEKNKKRHTRSSVFIMSIVSPIFNDNNSFITSVL